MSSIFSKYNLDKNLIRKIFNDNSHDTLIPTELFRLILNMEDREVSQIVNELGLFFEFDDTFDVDGTDDKIKDAICHEIECDTYIAKFVNSTSFRLMFWEKAGINASQAGYIAPGFESIFHKPNVKLVKRKGHELAFLLRHDSKGNFDDKGYRDISDLIENHGYTAPLLEYIVATNNKQRYEFNEDKTKIRARQGHSVKVDVELREENPPSVLYHGTAVTSLSSILEEGLKRGTRLHVHLSSDVETAVKVGSRHGEPIVLSIDTKAMSDDGILFYLSNNGVWLTDFVDPKYISVIE